MNDDMETDYLNGGVGTQSVDGGIDQPAALDENFGRSGNFGKVEKGEPRGNRTNFGELAPEQNLNALNESGRQSTVQDHEAEAWSFTDEPEPEPERPDTAYYPNRISRSKLEKALSGGNAKAAFTEDELLQANEYLLEPETGELDVLEKTARKIVMEDFLAGEFQMRREELHDVFDAAKKYYFGRDVDDNEAWKLLSEAYKWKNRPGLLSRLGHDAGTGMMALDSGIQNIETMLTEGLEGGLRIANAAMWTPIAWAARQIGFDAFAARAADAANPDKRIPGLGAHNDFMRQHLRDYRRAIELRAASRPGAANVTEEIAAGVVQNLPDFFFGIAMGLPTAGYGSLWYFGLNSFSNELHENQDNGNDPGKSLLNATVCGTAEVFFERLGTFKMIQKYFPAGIMQEKLARQLSGSIVEKSVAALTNAGIDAAGEGLEEVGTGITQRLSQHLLLHDRKSLFKMSAADWYNEIIRPAGMEFAVGAATGAAGTSVMLPAAVNRAVTDYQIRTAVNSFMRQGETLRQTVAAKENRSDAENDALDLLTDSIANDNVAGVIVARQVLQYAEAAEQTRLDEMSIEEQAEYAAVQAKALRKYLQNEKDDPGIQQRQIAESMQSIRSAATEFPNAGIVAVEQVADLPEKLRAAASRLSAGSQKHIEGVFDPESGTVYVVAANVPPARARKVLFHEVVAHKGLPSLIGKERYTVFLENVQRDFRREIDGFRKRKNGTYLSFQSGKRKVSQRKGGYLPDIEQSAALNETESQGQGDKRHLSSVETEVVEEFLAEMAEEFEAGRVDRSLWQRIIDAFREFLRRIPAFRNITYSRGEIEDLLALAAKKMRKKGAQSVDGGIDQSAALNGTHETHGTHGTKSEGQANEMPSIAPDNLSDLSDKSDLSDRSDEKAEDFEAMRSGDGLRFSVGGEKGARRMADAQIRLNNLNAARTMLEQGKDARTIKLATGWEKGGDGLWRFELPDVVLNKDFLRRGLSDRATMIMLYDLVDAPELFAAYPALENIPVRFASFQNPDGTPNDTTAGLYDPDEKTIYLSPRLVNGKDAEEIRSTLVHEIQHYIQHQEGFATGGSPELFDGKLDAIQKDIAAIRKEADASKKYRRYEELDQIAGKFLDGNGSEETFDAWYTANQEEYERLHQDPEVQKILDKINELYLKYNTIDAVRLWNNPNDENSIKNIKFQDDHYRLRMYQRLAGEVEARNAQKRAGMTEEEKRQSLLDDTADVAPEDRIYLNGDGGVSMMALPDDRMNFSSAIEDYKKGVLNKRVPVTVTSETPPVLLKLNLKDKGLRVFNRKITLPYSVIEKAVGDRVSTSTGEGHRLSLDTLKMLPDALYSPVMVLDSNTDNSLEIYVELTDQNNKPVVVALRLDQKIEREGKQKSEYVVNAIQSIYGKDNERTPVNRLLQGHGRYVNMRKAKSWFTAFGVQFPGASEIQLSSPFTIIDSSEKSSADSENMAKFSVGEGGAVSKQLGEMLALRILPLIEKYNAADILEEEVKTLLLEEGHELSDEELAAVIARGKMILRQRRSRIRAAKDHEYITSNYPWINILESYYGTSFKINPGPKYAGIEFTGSWISRDPKEGIAPDEAAKVLSQELRSDITDDDVFDFFKDLTKRQIFADRHAEKVQFDEEMKAEERLHDEELAESVLAGETPLSDDFIKTNPRVARMVRDRIAPRDGNGARADWAAVRAAIGHTEAGFVEGFIEGRKTGRSEYRELLREARKNQGDLKRTQELAVNFVKRIIPAEQQGVFLERIAALSKFTAGASVAYPNGRRAFELERLLGDLQSFDVKNRILALADKYAEKRNYKGIPGALLDEMQQPLNQIREILRMSDAAVETLRSWNQEQISALGEDSEAARPYIDSNVYIDVFGHLDAKTPAQLQEAIGALELLVSYGREKFLQRKHERLARLEDLRYRVIKEATGEGVPLIGNKAFHQPGFFDDGLAKHANLHTLLAWINRDSGVEFEKSVAGELWRAIEDASLDQDTRIRKMQENFDAMLAKLGLPAGVGGVAAKSAFFKELNKKVDHTGVFKTQYGRSILFGSKENEVVEKRRGYKRELIPVSRARKIVADFDAGIKGEDAPPVSYTVEFLRRQIADRDAGIKDYQYRLFGDEKDDAEMQRFIDSVKDADKQDKVILITPPAMETSAIQTEVPLSKDSAMQLLLSWEQPDLRAGMEFNGWSEKSIEQLKTFLGEKYMKFAYLMRDAIKAGRSELDAAARATYGAGLPQNDLYFPAQFRGSLGKEVRNDALLGSSYGQLSINPSFLISRHFHLLDADSDASAVANFLANQQEQAHFLAFRDVIRDCRGVFNSRPVREAITERYGRIVFDNLVDRIDVIAKGGRDTSKAVQAVAKWFKYWTPSKIAFNLSSIAKQGVGVFAYMNDIPADAFAAGWAESFTGSPLWDRFVAAAKKSDYLKNRSQGGMDKDLAFLLNSTRNIHNYSPLSTMLTDFATKGTRAADLFSVLHGGYAVFRYHYNSLLEKTGDQRFAWDEAMRQWRRSSDETQQSGALKDQNFYQSQAGFYRYLTTFLTNPVQIMNKEVMLFNDLLKSKGPRRAAAQKAAARMIFTNHFMMPLLFGAVTQFFRNGFKWDEWDFWDFLTGFVLGPFEGWLIAGKVVAALPDAFRRKPSFRSIFQALPAIDDSIDGIGQIIRFAQLDEWEGDDYLKMMKGFAELGMSSGVIHPAAGFASALSGAVSAGVREARRLKRIRESFEE